MEAEVALLSTMSEHFPAMKAEVQKVSSMEKMEKEISSMKDTLEKVPDAAKDAKYFSRKSYMEKGGKRN